MTQEKVIVIGKGLIGSSCTRYLSESASQVSVIGADEPLTALEEAEAQVFASHYDEARLTRRMCEHPLATQLADWSMQRYRGLERQSGIDFYRDVGVLVAQQPGRRPQMLRQYALEYFPPGDRGYQARFPEYRFPEDREVYFEPGPAGFVRPRRMARAQLKLAQAQGANIITDTVIDVIESKDSVSVITPSTRYQADKVIVCAGAFSNQHQLLPREIPLKVKTESYALVEVEDEEGLAELPCITYDSPQAELDGIYLTPLLDFADGHNYIKFGCDTVDDNFPTQLEEMLEWFKKGDNDHLAPAFLAAFRDFMPHTKVKQLLMKKCIVCYTPSGFPTIDWVSPRIAVATGGNGDSAKCADALGYLAAELLLHRPWPQEFDRQAFRLQEVTA